MTTSLGKSHFELLIRFTVRVFRKCHQFWCVSIFLFDFEGGMWGLIVLKTHF